MSDVQRGLAGSLLIFFRRGGAYIFSDGSIGQAQCAGAVPPSVCADFSSFYSSFSWPRFPEAEKTGGSNIFNLYPAERMGPRMKLNDNDSLVKSLLLFWILPGSENPGRS